jgi:hypothetical protein
MEPCQALGMFRSHEAEAQRGVERGAGGLGGAVFARAQDFQARALNPLAMCMGPHPVKS